MTFVPTKAADVVGVFDSGFNQVFPGARPLRASITDEALFFKHPLENSATRTDHVIFQPVKISISVMISSANYQSVYQQVKQIYKNQEQLIVQTKTDTYENMYIQSIPYEESALNFNSVIMTLVLEETILAETTITTVETTTETTGSAGTTTETTTEAGFVPENESDSKTKDRGQQEPVETTETQEQRGSTLSRWFS